MTARYDTQRMIDYLDGFGEEVQAALIPAAAAGAKVLYDRVKLNVAGIGRESGKLDASIYRVYSKDQSTDTKAVYHISWNHKKAPHGHLVEYGYLRRYEYYQNDDGQVRIKVRPEMQGKKRPSNRASRAQKNAYWVTLPSPIQVPGRAFVRSAAAAFDEACVAAEAEMARRLFGVI